MSNLPYTGGPDYGVARQVVGGGNPDPSYSTDRLLGYGMLDGLGRVLYHDDFASGLAHWTLVTAGTGIAAAIDTTAGRVFNPPNAVKLDASLANNDITEIRAVYHYQRGQRLGLETRWSLTGNCHHLELQLYYGPGAGVQQLGKLILDPVANAIEIQDNAGLKVVQSFDDAVFVQATYFGMKLVIDTGTGKYVRAIIGGNALNLSAYSLVTFMPGNDYIIDARCQASRVDGVNTIRPVWLGYVTVTVDEP